MINDKMETAETVSAVLTNAKTGQKRIIEENSPQAKAKYRIEVKVTNLETGEVQTYDDSR